MSKQTQRLVCFPHTKMLPAYSVEFTPSLTKKSVDIILVNARNKVIREIVGKYTVNSNVYGSEREWEDFVSFYMYLLLKQTAEKLPCLISISK